MTGRSQVWTGVGLDEPALVDLPTGRVAVFTEPCPGKAANEDSAACITTSRGATVLIVADGMGGQALGDRASATAVTRVAAAVERADVAGTSLREAVLDGAEAAQREVRSFGVGAGTTVVVAVLNEGRVRALHAGDSGALVVGQRGLVKLQTTMHSPTGYAVEAGLMEAHEALAHEDRHVISNYIGSEGMHMEIVAPLALADRDTVLLASDGLFDNLTPSEIVERVRKGPLERCARELCAKARARMRGESGKPDDLTFALFRMR